MKIKALNSIRHSKVRYRADAVLEIDDVRGARLIAQGFAEEAFPSAKPEAGEPVDQNTNKLVEEAAAVKTAAAPQGRRNRR